MGGGSPSLGDGGWGYFSMASVNGLRVLLFKSSLHVNQDGESLPLAPLVRQMLDETHARVILSIGTSGGVEPSDQLGDVMIATSAKFHLSDEFASLPENGLTYSSKWVPPKTQIAAAEKQFLDTPEFGLVAPCAGYSGKEPVNPKPSRRPRVRFAPLPILTTDRFEFGTTRNGLEKLGCCVEMDDAVIAKEAAAMARDFAFVRNISDPVINGDMHRALQGAWATATYYRRGLDTSINGALATWALIAGM